MSNNTQKFLKKLLTTTSALAIIAGGANSTLAAAGHNIGAGAINLSDMGIAGVNDWVIFNGGATLTVNIGSPAQIAGIDVAVNPGGATVINNNITIGSISGVAGPMAITINNARLILNGTAFGGIGANTYDKLGAITLNHNNSRLIIDADITLPQIQGYLGGGDQGMITVNDNKIVTLTKGINPAQLIGQLKLGTNAQVELNHHAGFSKNGTAIELGNNSVLKVSGKSIKGIAYSEEINGAAPDNGTLIFTGGDSTLENIEVGNTNRIHELRIASAHTLESDDSPINATMINFTADGTLKTNSNITGKIDNTSGGANAGTLQLTRALTVNGNIGQTHPLKEIKFDAAEVVNLKGTANAQAFSINDPAAVVNATGLMTGAVNFTKAGTLNANGGVTGDIDFANNAGTVNVVGLITGNVDSTVDANGTLNFTANGGVTGTIGATTALNAINIKNGAVVTLHDAIVNATTITIGDAAAATLIRGGDVNFDLNAIGAGQTVFAHADSILKLQSTGGNAKTVTLQNNVNPGANKGIVELHANGPNSALVITGNGVKTLGTNANKLKELRITGDQLVTIKGGAGDNVDLTNVDVLNVKAGAKLLAETATVAAIVKINIGEAGAGAGTLTLDATANDVDLMPNGGDEINFLHEDSLIKFVSGDVGVEHLLFKIILLVEQPMITKARLNCMLLLEI